MPFFKSIRSGFLQGIFLLAPFHAAAWTATAEPIEKLLNAPTEEEKDKLTSRWRESIQEQLTSIASTGALVGGIVTSALAWPSMSTPTGYNSTSGYSSWTVQALWYASLLLSLTAVCAATQQGVLVHRLACYPDSETKIRQLLGESRGALVAGAQHKAAWLQLYIWQLPISMLNGSVYLFVTGLAVLLWDAAKLEALGAWGRDVKIVVLFMLALVFCIGNYMVATIGLYSRVRQLTKTTTPK